MPDFGRWTGGGDPSLNEIARTDRFFDALASNEPVYSTDREEAELAFLLSGWRDDVREAPVTVPVSTGAAIDALEAGLSKGNRGARRSFAIIGSVAAAVLCIGGFGTAVYGAGPGDSLYGMRTAMFGQAEATRDEQVSLASAQLAQVQQLIDNGQWQEAQDKLVAVSTAVQGVGPVDQKQQLVDQWNALTYKVVEQNPAATLPPGEPLPVLPSSPLTWLPAPVVEGTTSTSTSTSTTTSTSTSGTSTSDTTSTSPVDTTSPSETPTTSSEAAPSSSVAPSTSSSASTTASPPSSSTSSSAAPASSSATPTTTATTTTTTTTTTLPTRAPEATQQASPSSAAPAVKPSPSAVEAPAPQPPTPPSPAAATPAAPTAASEAPAERPSPAPTTTTVRPPA